MGENILTMPGIRYAVTLNGAQVYELAKETASGTSETTGAERRVAEFPLSEEEAPFRFDTASLGAEWVVTDLR